MTTEQREAEELAERVGTHIPGGIHLPFWSLPILVVLLERIEKLEQRIQERA